MFPKYLKRAVRVAEQNTLYPKWRLGSIIVKGNSVLASGQSRILTDPSQCDFSAHSPRPNVSLHAEIDSLRKAPRASGGTLYVARIGRNGKIGLSRPCPECRKAILESGIKRVIYTIDEDTFGTWQPRREE